MDKQEFKKKEIVMKKTFYVVLSLVVLMIVFSGCHDKYQDKIIVDVFCNDGYEHFLVDTSDFSRLYSFQYGDTLFNKYGTQYVFLGPGKKWETEKGFVSKHKITAPLIAENISEQRNVIMFSDLNYFLAKNEQTFDLNDYGFMHQDVRRSKLKRGILIKTNTENTFPYEVVVDSTYDACAPFSFFHGDTLIDFEGTIYVAIGVGPSEPGGKKQVLWMKNVEADRNEYYWYAEETNLLEHGFRRKK